MLQRSMFRRACCFSAPSSRSFLSSISTNFATATRSFSWTHRHEKVVEMSASEAILKMVPRDGAQVYIHMGAAAPSLLTKALAQDDTIKNCTSIHLLLNPTAAHHLSPSCYSRIRANYLFVGSEGREAVNSGHADFTPAFYQQIPKMFRQKQIPLDVALITVSPPDQHGWCSLGTSIGCDLAAVQSAKSVVAQVSTSMPRTHGDGFVHLDQIDALVDAGDTAIWEYTASTTPVDKEIAKNVVSLIPDGACLQVGIGSIGTEIAGMLDNHKDLGIHTEMISDSVVDLVKKGVINGFHKKHFAGQIVCTYLLGTKKLYNFCNNNPDVIGLDVAKLNVPHSISLNPKQHSINSAIEIDVTGQVCSDSIGRSIYSGIGGQMDFMRGAALSVGGKPIICLPSTTSKGDSRIVPILKEGAGVVTTRAHVHYVVTEYGTAYLYGRSLVDRARALISIAHPKHRDALTAAAVERYGKH